ncbi:bem46 protein, variant [Tilletia horrida]|uniref:Bem46 protein, variant n=1 Tax=Tilletia horrida TaxID=155126 RepID=A0AAN6G716_9BASI|nr:bem46 protein, variant [Tilletia horrida]KAK0523491.1 bem46 protein, variant [Tilletia horrida]KAK0524112.1 bem46 protein, variant [Tilletia horrida]
MTVFRSIGALMRILSGVLVLGVASTACLLWRYQGLLVYPASFPQGSRTVVDTPDSFGMPYDEVTLTTPDGEQVRCFVILQRTPSDKERAAGLSGVGDDTARRRPTIIFFHANAGNLGHRLPIAAVFYRRFGANVVMLSYRGYGLSTGTPSERGIRIDAQTLMDWIHGHPVLRSTHLVVYGQSLGGAVAVDVASRPSNKIAAVILENTFLSIPELIPHVLPPLRPFSFLCREIWATGSLIRTLRMPVLFLSGRQDQLVPPSHMDTLYERCPSKEKSFKPFDDGTHNDTCVKPGYFEEISNFLLRYIVPLPPRSTSPPLSRPAPSSLSSAAPAAAADDAMHAELRRRSAHERNPSAAGESAVTSSSASIISGATSPVLVDKADVGPAPAGAPSTSASAQQAGGGGYESDDGEGTGSDWVEMSLTDADPTQSSKTTAPSAAPAAGKQKTVGAGGLAPKDTVQQMLAEEAERAKASGKTTAGKL